MASIIICINAGQVPSVFLFLLNGVVALVISDSTCLSSGTRFSICVLKVDM